MQQIAPNRSGALAFAILFSRQTREKQRLDVVGIKRERTIKRTRRLGCDNAVGGPHQGFAKIGLGIGGLAHQPQPIAPRFDSVVKTPHAHINGRQNLPSAAVLRILGEMILDLGDQGGERTFLHWRVEPCRQRSRRLIR